MSDKISTLVSGLLEGIHGISKSETIVGEPQRAGDATIIPVHRLKIAFGAAAAKAGAHNSRVGGDTGGGGAGGAIELDPVAAIAIAKDGTAHMLTVEADSSATWAGLMEEVPELIARVVHSVGGKMARVIDDKMDAKLAAKGDALAPVASDAEES